MCRWIVYAAAAGDAHRPLQLSDLLCKPRHSLVRQAFAAGAHPFFSAKNNAIVNADGTGISWYSQDGRCFIFKTSSPAWSDKNLREVADFACSHVVIGHVRAASPGSIVGHESTHPFKHGRLVFVHNGHIEGFASLRRAFSARLSDEAFSSVKGLTDSEHAFALLLTALHDPGRRSPFAPGELAAAMEVTVSTTLNLLVDAGVEGGFTSLNFALTDGETVVVTRFCDKWPAIPPPSLYVAFPTADELRRELDADAASPGGGGGRAAPGDGAANAAAAAAAAEDDEAGAADAAGDAAYGVDSARWARDEAFLAAAAPTARSRALLVASEPATAGGHVTWLTLPANSMLVYERGAGGVPALTRLAPAAMAAAAARGDGGAGASGGAGAMP